MNDDKQQITILDSKLIKNTNLSQSYYSDIKLSKYDVLYVKQNKVSTLIKPQIWRNEIFNLHTNNLIQNTNNNYCIGIEIIRSICCPIILYRILTNKKNSAYYGIKMRSYKDISTCSFEHGNYLTFESKLTMTEDYINKLVDFDDTKLNLEFSESSIIGYSNSGNPHKRSIVYLSEKDVKNSFLFLYENNIYSDKYQKYISRTFGLRIVSMDKQFGFCDNPSKQSSTIMLYNMIVGQYENDFLQLELVNDDRIEDAYLDYNN